jgi:hypothetical protein
MQEWTLSGAPPGSIVDGPERMELVQLHSVHWEDANEAELAVTVEFISAVHCLFGPGTRVPLKSTAHAFVDFIVEARKL